MLSNNTIKYNERNSMLPMRITIKVSNQGSLPKRGKLKEKQSEINRIRNSITIGLCNDWQ